jgi:hypothetical protein
MFLTGRIEWVISRAAVNVDVNPIALSSARSCLAVWQWRL